VGDKVVLDLEVETMNTTTSVASNSSITFGSANTSNVVMPAKVAFSYASPAVVPTAGHLGALYTGLHRPNPAEENLQRIAAAKHVECSDCHDPHQARRGNQADGGTATAGAAGSLTDANQSWAANAWVGYYVDVLSGTSAGGRAQITANTATQLTFAASVTPGTGSGYRVSMRENAGTVTASSSTGSSTTLTDGNTTPRAKAWQTDLFKGWFVTVILASGDTQTGVVAGNGGTTITVATDASHPFPPPANGAQYVVTKLPNVLTGAGGVGASSWGATTANWTTPTYDTDQTAAIPDATTQWQVCLK
jgi:hypothetical protein